MKKTLYLMVFSFLLILFSSGIFAQKLVIRLNNGAESIEPLSTVQKLYFLDNELIVDFISGVDDAYNLADIRKLYFDEAVAIDDHILPGVQKLSVYPNPAGDFITVRGIPAGAGLLSIYRMDGGLAMNKAVSADHETIDISSLRNGLYLVKASGFTTKFIKK